MPSQRLRTILRRTTIAVVALLLVAAACGSYGWYRITHRGLTPVSGTVRVDGLSAPATIRRDGRGIPYIDAAGVSDVYFAQGFACAQDRLWQMDLLRRDASGELSELVGAVAFDRDAKHRRLGFRLVCERALATLDAAPRAALDRYCDGVNAYVAMHRDELPVEFTLLRYEPRPWTPVDSLVIGKLMAETLGSTYERDLMRASFSDLDPQIYADLFVSHSRDDVPFVGTDSETAPAQVSSEASGTSSKRISYQPESPGDEILAGSNNWVVAGSRTQSGKPLLANDPHLALALPPIWYAAHLKAADGALDVAGVTFPGVPGIVIGHNASIAWGVTNFGPDVQDLYAEQFDESGRRYRAGDTWLDADVRTEHIRVRKGSLTTECDDRSVDVVTTRHGPVIKDDTGVRFALRWTALDPVSELTAFYMLNRARSWGEFQDALRTYPGPMQNFVFADTSGDIGYTAAGNVPIRRTGSGDTPYDGATGDGDWLGFIPFDRLPRAYNPSTGFIATANNRIVGDSIPEFYTKEWISPYRANRITSLLEAGQRLGPDDMNAIQNDTYSHPDFEFARVAQEMAAARIAAGDASAADWTELSARLQGFDGRLDADSTAAAVVSLTRHTFDDRVLKAKLGDRMADYAWFSRETLYTNLIEDRPAAWLPPDAPSWEQVVLDAYRETRTSLTDRFGANSDGWRYGLLNSFLLAHPLGRNGGPGSLFNLAPFEIGGGPNAIKAIGVLKGWGPSMRLVVDLGDLDATTLVLPAGESGQPASPHYTDETDDWRIGRTHVFPFSDAAVDRATVDTLQLTPAV